MVYNDIKDHVDDDEMFMSNNDCNAVTLVDYDDCGAGISSALLS